MAVQPLNARTETILRRLARRDSGAPLKKVLAKARPEDVAAAMEHLTAKQMRRLYALIEDREFAAEVLAHLSDEATNLVTREMTEEAIVELLEHMEPDDATDVVEVLPELLRARVIEEMQDDEEHADALELLAWPSDSAGGIMSPVVFHMPDTATCGNAIITLQEHHEELENVYYLYVTDADGVVVGVVSMRQLLVHPPGTPLVSIMNPDVISVGPRQDQEEVARYVARYDLLALPVIDERGRMMGVVTVDDVVDVIREEAAEDMMLMAGVHGEVPELQHGSALQFARQRAGWLLATAFGGIVAERLTSIGGAGLDVEVLAGFIPVVMGMGGNVGIQSTTLAVRGLATGAVQVGGAAAFVWREVQVGLILGVLYGVLLASYGLFTGWPDPSVSLVVGSSVLIAISLGSLLGSGLPVLLQRMGHDPAVATGPFVTTGVDIMGIFVYFQVARLLMGAV